MTEQWTVAIDSYSLDEGRVGSDEKPIARWVHRTPRAACRRLATVIARRTKKYDGVIPRGSAGRFYIITPGGCTLSLKQVRSRIDATGAHKPR